MTEIRLQKYLADSGVCSRRHGEALITAGRVRVNGVVVTEQGTKVEPGVDEVLLDDAPVVLPETQNYVYIALNKPKGYVSSCAQDNASLVVDLVPQNQRVFPVGRLDKDSTGLILLTNDGRLHLQMSHPSFNHEKEYEVRLKLPAPAGALHKLREGVMLDGVRTRPAKISVLKPDLVRVILQEGRNRQIRRMFKKVGNEVLELKRIRFGNIRLGGLKEGRWRYLTQPEVESLLGGLSRNDQAKSKN